MRARLATFATGALATGALGLLASCDSGSGPPVRDCSITVWARASKVTPSVTGTWTDWTPPGTPMTAYGDEDWYSVTLTLPPGEHGYLVTDDTGTHPDPYNPQRTYHGEAEVSLAIAQDCSLPEVKVDSVTATEAGEITVTGTFYRSPSADPSGAALESVTATSPSGAALSPVTVSPETGKLVLRGSGFPRGKHTFTLEARDATGTLASSPRAVAWVKPAAARWDEGILYQVVIDRFRDGDGAALAPPQTPGHRAGGTLDGVRAALESGYFDKLGVSTLWISPVYLNPDGLFEGVGGHLYEGYHGYWPKGSRETEPKIGGEQALRALVAAAHAKGVRVLFDFVPNHVHDQNPRYLDHKADGWFNDGPATCVCGTSGCGWDQRILDCWFAPYLPDIRWQSAEATREALGDLAYWMDTFDADGVRIDAVPMMPRLASRRMALSLRTNYAPPDAMFSIGEVFTGAGEQGLDAIKYFLGPDGIAGAFDFPLTWALRSGIATGKGNFTEIEQALSYSEQALAGSGSVLGRMVDNHDMSRFLSEASGHSGASAWSNPAPDPADTRPYDKLRVALGLVMTVPGLPVLFQGDEVGLAGGTDPDNRRVLPDEGALSESQRSVLDATRAAARVRACSVALKRGSRKAFLITDTTYGFARIAPEEAAVVLISTDDEQAQIVPPLKLVPPGAYVDAFTSETFEIGGGAPVPVAPYSLRILLPENSPCLSLSTPEP